MQREHDRFRRRARVLPAFVLAAVGACTADAPDGGASLVELGPVGGEGAGQARLESAADGTPVLSFIEPREDTEALEYAVLRDGVWSEPVTVVERADLFVNWADLPSVVQLDENRWVSHFLVLKPDHYAAYDIEYATSQDGVDWSESARLNDDETETEHGFVTLFDWDGATGAVWLDGRDWAETAQGAAEPAGTQVRFARLGADGGVLASGVIDEIACECCKTDVALARGGPVLAYRDRTRDEIRDVVVRRFDGAAWSDAEVLGDDGWRIEGCPVNGPAIDARNDSVAVAWFTGADDEPRVQLAWSRDGAASFGGAIEIDAGRSFGQADVVLLDEETAVVSWWRRGAEDGIVLAARRVARDGSLGPVREVARSSLSQPLDVPQLEPAGDGGVVFAWTELDDTLRVRTAYAGAGWF